jgi:hypothetical protein
LTGLSPVPGEGWYLSNRWSHGPQIRVAARWIRSCFDQWGLNATLHKFDSNFGPNVIGELRGTTHPDEIYIFCGHYDTCGEFCQEVAPGCDDNGSGTAAVLMAARILSHYRFDATIRFVAFSGEEQWLVGSTAYAKACRKKHEDIRGLLNLDMFLQPTFDDWRTTADYDLDLGGDRYAQSLAEFTAWHFRRYTPIAVEIHPPDVIISDHTAFCSAHFPAVGMLENSDAEIWSGSNDAYHQMTDVISKPQYEWDFALHTVRGALATLIALARLNPPEAGDLNGDGRVSFADAAVLATMLAGEPTSFDACSPRRNADCNRDGRIDVADLPAFVARFLAE